jgi:hypothetical protein
MAQVAGPIEGSSDSEANWICSSNHLTNKKSQKDSLGKVFLTLQIYPSKTPITNMGTVLKNYLVCFLKVYRIFHFSIFSFFFNFF